jgi:hypothetical protein
MGVILGDFPRRSPSTEIGGVKLSELTLKGAWMPARSFLCGDLVAGFRSLVCLPCIPLPPAAFSKLESKADAPLE